MRPKLSEIPDFYRPYIESLPDEPLMLLLQNTLDRFNKLFSKLDEEQGEFRYEKGKWSIKEVLQHLIDGERVFTYRALRFSRNDPTDLPGFDQDDYVIASKSDSRKLSKMVDEFNTLRRSSVDFYESLDLKQLLRKGTANGYEFSVNSIGYITVGHLNHHLKILEERYLVILND